MITRLICATLVAGALSGCSNLLNADFEQLSQLDPSQTTSLPGSPSGDALHFVKLGAQDLADLNSVVLTSGENILSGQRSLYFSRTNVAQGLDPQQESRLYFIPVAAEEDDAAVVFSWEGRLQAGSGTPLVEVALVRADIDAPQLIEPTFMRLHISPSLVYTANVVSAISYIGGVGAVSYDPHRFAITVNPKKGEYTVTLNGGEDSVTNTLGVETSEDFNSQDIAMRITFLGAPNAQAYIMDDVKISAVE